MINGWSEESPLEAPAAQLDEGRSTMALVRGTNSCGRALAWAVGYAQRSGSRLIIVACPRLTWTVGFLHAVPRADVAAYEAFSDGLAVLIRDSGLAFSDRTEPIIHASPIGGIGWLSDLAVSRRVDLLVAGHHALSGAELRKLGQAEQSVTLIG